MLKLLAVMLVLFSCDRSTVFLKLKVLPVALIVPKLLTALPAFVSVELPAVLVSTKVLAVKAPDCVKPPATLSTKVKVRPVVSMVPKISIAFVALSSVVLPDVAVTFNVVAVMAPLGCVIVPVLIKLATLPLTLAPKLKFLLVPAVVRVTVPVPALIA